MCIYKHHNGEGVNDIENYNCKCFQYSSLSTDRRTNKEAIFTGELQDGDILPSIRNLANDLQVSVLTIRRVYDELEKEGFLVCRVGVGSFISTSNLDKLKDSKRRVLEEKVWDMLQQAKTLGISKEELHCMLDALCEEE